MGYRTFLFGWRERMKASELSELSYLGWDERAKVSPLISEHSSFEIPFPETFSSWGGEGVVYGWRWVPVVRRVFNLSDGSASSYVSWGRIFCDCLWSQIALLQLASFVILRVKSFCSTTWLTWNRYSLACFWSLFSFCFSCYTKMFCFAVSRRCACSLRI